MKNKILRFLCLVFIALALLFLIIISNRKSLDVLGYVFAGFFSISLERIVSALQDFLDTSDWKSSQRKLKRGGFIRDDTEIRISFAYLFRIKIGTRYLLIENGRKTGKYQPVGGVFKFSENEKKLLKNKFHVMDDDKIQLDESSRDDYRLRMQNKYLRGFMRRFDSKKAERERIEDLSREFKEELIDTGILPKWSKIKYRYCGRHISELQCGVFKTYELLLADIVELIPTEEQKRDLEVLRNIESSKYVFENERLIESYGIDTENDKMRDCIANHSFKILQTTEPKLMSMKESGNEYSVSIV